MMQIGDNTNSGEVLTAFKQIQNVANQGKLIRGQRKRFGANYLRVVIQIKTEIARQ